jgi:general secretion pathway protein G
MRGCTGRAFTLVEVLIVVVILGILAAIIIPQFASASGQAASNTTYSELQKLRRQVGVFRARTGALPVLPGGGDAEAWGPLVGNSGEYMLTPPVNAWVGGVNARRIEVVENAIPDAAYHTDYGWIYDPLTGNVWAGAFDGDDRAHPRP